MKDKVEIDTGQMMVTVDPGDRHVGVAYWTFEDGAWGCEHAQEMEPEQFTDYLRTHLVTGAIGTVVYESWQLYGDKAAEQVGSEMLTSQLIGVIKYLVRQTQVNWPMNAPQIFSQQAAIKTPTRAILKKRQVVSVAKRLKQDPDGHAFDAELHGYHFLGVNKLPTRYPSKDFPRNTK